MGIGDAVLPAQPADHSGVIATGIDLLQAQHDRDIGHAPGMDVEHRRKRHVHIVDTETPMARIAGMPAQGERVQNQLPVTEADPLGIAGRAAGEKGGRNRILVEIPEREVGVGGAAQHLVFARRPSGQRFVASVHDGDDGLQFRHRPPNIIDQGKEVAVDEDDARIGVGEGVKNLLERQANIHRLQHRAHHRNREIGLQIAMAVPVQHRDRRPLPASERGEQRCQPTHALRELPIGVAKLIAIDDLLVRGRDQCPVQKMADRQRIMIGLVTPLGISQSHTRSPSLSRPRRCRTIRTWMPKNPERTPAGLNVTRAPRCFIAKVARMTGD